MLYSFIILLSFSIDGLKSTIFKLFLCIILLIVYRKKMIVWYPMLFVTLCLTAFAEFKIFNSDWISSTIIRRSLFIPSLLDTYYFDYIYQNGPIFYQRGGEHISFFIGAEYFGKEEMRSNNGLFSDAYMNLGFLGLIIYPIIYSFFFRFCESISRGLDEKIVMFVGVIMVSSMNSSELTTCLLTHGLLALILLLYFIPKTVNINKY